MAFPQENLLLQALPFETRSALLASSEPVTLPAGHVLFEAAGYPRYGHFITSGIASVVTVLSAGDMVEVRVVGREGIPEATHLLGPLKGMTRCFMQVDGTGVRIDFNRLEEKFWREPALRRLILRLVQHNTFSMAQLSTCNRLHGVKERMARWLLMVKDRTGEPEIRLTQESLSQMLGARRSTVNLAASTLHRMGAIAYRRSHIMVMNEEILRDAACECYPVMQQLLQDLYKGPHAVSSNAVVAAYEPEPALKMSSAK